MLGLGVLGCGSDSPEEQCENLVSLVCDRAGECLPSVEPRHGECFQQLRRLARCERIASHSPTYDACMNSVEASACNVLFSELTSTRLMAILPSQCSAVVDLEASAARPVAPLPSSGSYDLVSQ